MSRSRAQSRPNREINSEAPCVCLPDEEPGPGKGEVGGSGGGGGGFAKFLDLFTHLPELNGMHEALMTPDHSPA